MRTPWLLLACLGIRRWGWLRMVPLIALELLLARAVGALRWPVGMGGGLPLILAGALLEGGLLRWLSGLALWRLALPVGAAIAFADEMLVATSLTKLHFIGLLAGATLIVGAVASADHGATQRLLRRRVSQFLGRISFSLYLWNPLALYILSGVVGWQNAQARPLEVGLGIGAAAVLLTIPVAYLAEIWAERPFIRLGRIVTRPAAGA